MAAMIGYTSGPGATVNQASHPTAPKSKAAMRLLAVAIILLVIDLALFAWFDDVNPGAAQALTHPSRSLVAATGNFLIDSINEKPNLATVAPDTNPPICASVDDRYVPALTKAFSLMRWTDEGERL